MCFLCGYSWVLMAAKLSCLFHLFLEFFSLIAFCCAMPPSSTLPELIIKFFTTYAIWNWANPVIISLPYLVVSAVQPKVMIMTMTMTITLAITISMIMIMATISSHGHHD